MVMPKMKMNNTNPIPGADSERELKKAANSLIAAFNDPSCSLASLQNYVTDLSIAARAAAKVGANVAADDVSVLLGKALIDLRNNCKDEFLVNGVSHWIEGAMKIIAPGAPAETPKPVAVHFVQHATSKPCAEWTEVSAERLQSFADGGFVTRTLYAAQPIPALISEVKA